MAIASSREGSETKNGWKRRVKQDRRSIYFWYSLMVVAPIARSSPLPKRVANIFEASIEPSARLTNQSMYFIYKKNDFAFGAFDFL